MKNRFIILLSVFLAIFILLLFCIYLELSEANELQKKIIDYLYNVNHNP